MKRSIIEPVGMVDERQLKICACLIARVEKDISEKSQRPRIIKQGEAVDLICDNYHRWGLDKCQAIAASLYSGHGAGAFYLAEARAGKLEKPARTRAEFLDMLDENTHVLFTSEICEEANNLFGVNIKPSRYKADGDSDPKGLTLNNGAKYALGISAFHLAPSICHQLGVQYQDAFGRDFLVRNCTSALRAAGFDK